MKSVDSSKAETHLPRLLSQVEKGESITITKRGKAIAVLSPARQVPERDVHAVIAEFRAYMESTLRDHLDANPNLIQEGTHGVEGGKAAMERIFASGARPTAVLGSNDLTAIGAMGAIFDRGLRIPEDISVIGYDNIQLCAYTMPPLTTVSLPRLEIANAAFRALFDPREAGPSKRPEGQEHKLHPTFVIRKSTGPAPK